MDAPPGIPFVESLRAALEELPGLFAFATTRCPHTLVFNRAARELFDVTRVPTIAALQTALVGGRTTFDHDVRLPDRMGKSLRVRVAASPLADSSGSIVGAIAELLPDLSDLRSALAAAEQRYRELGDWLPIHVSTRDPNGRLLYINAAWYQYTGREPGVLTNETWWGAIHPDDLARVRRERGDAIPKGRPIQSELRVRRADGVYRWFLNRSVPVRAVDGTVTSWIGTMTDIDEQKRAEETLRVLSEASALFGDVPNVELEQTLRLLAELLVLHLADTCTIDLVAPDGSIWNVAVAARSPEQRRILRARVFRHRRISETILTQVARTVRPYRSPLLAPAEIAALLPEGEPRELALALGRRALLIVPIVIDVVLGTIVLGNTDTARAFTPDDERLALVIARRAAIAISNARMYERQREVAHTLQAAFLPPALPQTPEVAFDGVYVAAADDVTIGGDWYDAFRNDAGTYGFSIGDIEGHGLESAVTMGKMRQTLNTLAFAGVEPVAALALADGVLEREHPETFATAFAARYDPRTGELVYANAGHPAPAVRAADGALRWLATADVPLGLGPLAPRAGHREPLRGGDVLIAFTDGLIELHRDACAGERRIVSVLAHPAFAVSSAPAALARAMLVDAEALDDIAVLAMVVGRSGVWSFDARDRDDAQHVRDAFFAALAEAGITGDARLGYEIIFGELLANVVRYTPGRLDLGLRCLDDGIQVTALDRGPGFAWKPVRPEYLSESGRGLFLIAAFASNVRLEHLAGFGSYLEVLVPREAGVLRTR